MMQRCSAVIFLLCMVRSKCALGLDEPQQTINVVPETWMSIDEMVHYHGYTCQSHDVITTDGFILTLKRISQDSTKVMRKSTPVFLQHGLLDSAATWVFNGPNKSLAYILADAGYDVWLGNSRGNTYSKRHTKYPENSNQFWDFSFEEFAKYDLTASIDYVTQTTNQSQVYYIGHSQGTLIGIIEFSRNIQLRTKIKQFIALAPVASVNHVQGVFKYISKVFWKIEYILKLLGVREFSPSNWLTKYFANLICTLPIGDYKCANMLFLIAGPNSKNLELRKIPIYLAHTPAGTSVKNVVHFAQLKRSGLLQQYDYGSTENIKKYGQIHPPLYDISKMYVPIALFSASNDWLSTPEDINKSIRGVLPNIIYDHIIDEYNHLDFIWGQDAAEKVYTKILTLFSNN